MFSFVVFVRDLMYKWILYIIIRGGYDLDMLICNSMRPCHIEENIMKILPILAGSNGMYMDVYLMPRRQQLLGSLSVICLWNLISARVIWKLGGISKVCFFMKVGNGDQKLFLSLVLLTRISLKTMATSFVVYTMKKWVRILSLTQKSFLLRI